MSAALSASVSVVAYLTLFAGVGIVFLFANLLIGRFVRPANPSAEKGEIYECGEPAIGSSFVQFDLRFYVVALLFIVFDVEVAFFFPWAAVFGKSTHLMDTRFQVATSSPDGVVLTPAAQLPLSGTRRALSDPGSGRAKEPPGDGGRVGPQRPLSKPIASRTPAAGSWPC